MKISKAIVFGPDTVSCEVELTYDEYDKFLKAQVNDERDKIVRDLEESLKVLRIHIISNTMQKVS